MKLWALTALLFCAPLMAQRNCGTPNNPCFLGYGPTPVKGPNWTKLELATDAAWTFDAGADVVLSHRCIIRGQCHEGNPLLSNSLAVTSPIVAVETFGSMWMFHHYRSKTKLAWLIPAVNIGVHLAAIAKFEHGR